MKEVSTSETSVNFHETTRPNIPDGCHLHTHDGENLNSHVAVCWEDGRVNQGVSLETWTRTENCLPEIEPSPAKHIVMYLQTSFLHTFREKRLVVLITNSFIPLELIFRKKGTKNSIM
jgi:hypothetical protein